MVWACGRRAPESIPDYSCKTYILHVLVEARPKSAMELPDELVALVFTHLTARDLDAVRGVCRRWRLLASEPAWRHVFFKKFGTTRIARIVPSESWRTELIARETVLKRWKKLAKQTDVTFNSQLFDATHVFMDFQQQRVICVNAHKNRGAVFCANRGKLLRKFSDRDPAALPFSAVAGNRSALALGRYDGSVALRALSTGSSSTHAVGDPIDSPVLSHLTAVTALWMSPVFNILKPCSQDQITIASASTDGGLVVANLASDRHKRYALNSPVALVASCTKTVSTTQVESLSSLVLKPQEAIPQTGKRPNNKPPNIQAHRTNHQTSHHTNYMNPPLNSIISVCHDGQVYLADFEECTKIVSLPTQNPFTKLLCNGNFAVIVAGSVVFIVDTLSKTFKQIDYGFPVCAAVVDETSTSGPVYCAIAIASTVFVYELGTTKTVQLFSLLSHVSFPEPVSQLAINAVVLLVSGNNGQTVAYDPLGGEELRRVNSRFPRSVVEYRLYTNGDSLPTSHLIIDPDVYRIRGCIVLKGAVQYFEAAETKIEEKKSRKPKPQLSRRRSSALSRHEIVELNDIRRTAAEDDANARRERAASDDFVVADLDDDEQLRLALLISGESAEAEVFEQAMSSASTSPSLLPTTVESSDDELERAIAASLADPEETPEEAELRIAIERSLLES